MNHTTPPPTDPGGAAPAAAPAAPPQAPAPRDGHSPRDAQRAALRDLVQLATDSAATEAQIEQRRQRAMEESDALLKRSTWEAEQRYRTTLDGVRQAYDEKLAELTAANDAATLKQREADRAVRHRINRDHDALQQQLKKRLDQATWLADSHLEGAENLLRDEARKTREEAEGRGAEIAEVERQVTELFQTFGVEPPPTPPIEPVPVDEHAAALFDAKRDESIALTRKLKHLTAPRLLAGGTPYLIVLVVLICAAAAAQFATGKLTGDLGAIVPQWRPIGIATGGAAVLLVAAGLLTARARRTGIARVYVPLRQALDAARSAIDAHLGHADHLRQQKQAQLVAERDAEVEQVKSQVLPAMERATKKRDAALVAAKHDADAQWTTLRRGHLERTAELEDRKARLTSEAEARYAADVQAAHDEHEARQRDARRAYEEAHASLARRLKEDLARIHAPIRRRIGVDGKSAPDWDDPAWKDWAPPQHFAAAVPIGKLDVDLRAVAGAVPHAGEMKIELPEPFAVPVSLAFPRQASLLIQADRAGRDAGIRLLQMVMARILTSLPPGRARFTLIDPVGLGQNFAGFMHLADFDDNLVGGRIWTSAEQIEQRLANLTEHMETVIQKYLRNEFETIDEYNAQAGELAEPYRFLVIADFPVGFESDAWRRLSSIINTGARCGVYTLILRDARQPLPQGAHLDEIEANAVNLVHKGDHFVWKDEVFGRFPLHVDAPPTEDFLTGVLQLVGQGAKDANRVEVPFDTITPQNGQFWSGDSSDELTVPIGRTGATRLQSLRLGRGVAQHVLIAGKTGSGKSTLLHALVTNLAMWYSPAQVEFYLVDFKKGVEFKTYATHGLPHARAIAVESDREFGLSVLQRLDAELARRGELYRRAGVQDLASYRKTPGAVVMPRTLLVIDEFQEFFSEDDRIAQDAALLIDRLVRQGRAFGVHVLLGSQTIGGAGLARTTLGQMAVRIALQTSEADSHLILGDGNAAARLLTRPGEAIYNDAGGMVEGNSPFQIAWLSDEQRERYLDRVRTNATGNAYAPEPAVVFEGSAPGDVTHNRVLTAMLAAPAWPPQPVAARAHVGEPVVIKDPTAIHFRRQAGTNVLMIGQQEESAVALVQSAMVSIAAQQAPRNAVFHVMDGSPADSALAGSFVRMKAALPHEVNLVEWRYVGETINALAAELQRRQENGDAGAPSVYLVVYGLQRYRLLRKQEESFSFSTSDDAEKKPDPAKQFADLLREGPPLGIHVIAWADTLAAVERTLDRGSMREFDNRILFQMSAADSSNLIDSPAANKLGFYRALAYSEEQGVMEKFRPYGIPPQPWLDAAAKALRSRTPQP